MADGSITLACRNYDGTNAIIRGALRPQGIDLLVNEVNDVVKMFSGMFKGEYDVAEMSLAEMIYYLTRDQCDFIGIPVFPSRLFRHSFMLCNQTAGIRRPENLTGKRIGGLRWVQTAFIWLRGMLVDEYNLSAKDTDWYVSALHHWNENGSEERIMPRDGSIIRHLQREGDDEYEMSCRALVDGKIDMLMTTENRKYDWLAGQPRVRPLFTNVREAEAAYYKKTGTERIPRFDSRAIPVLLEFDQVKGVTADALAPRVIDNSIVDQLAEEKFFEKFFGKELR